MSFRSQILLAGFLFSPLLVPPVAEADPINVAAATSARLLATGGDVSIHFAGSDAGFDSVLFLDAPTPQGPFFPNHATSLGEMADLGFFASGAELIFRLHVADTGDDFFTGSPSRNPDGLRHAQAVLWAGSPAIPAGVLVGFEDLFGGGDLDFNDFQFVVTNATLADVDPVPEPSALILFGTGALALARRVRRTRKGIPSAS